jgi:hypothetical protein
MHVAETLGMDMDLGKGDERSSRDELIELPADLGTGRTADVARSCELVHRDGGLLCRRSGSDTDKEGSWWRFKWRGGNTQIESVCVVPPGSSGHENRLWCGIMVRRGGIRCDSGFVPENRSRTGATGRTVVALGVSARAGRDGLGRLPRPSMRRAFGGGRAK